MTIRFCETRRRNNNKEAIIKRVLALFLSILLIAGCFALTGCQGTLENPKDSSIPKEVEPKEVEPKEITVYITRTGECYHRAGCQYLRQSCISVDLDDVRGRYRP